MAAEVIGHTANGVHRVIPDIDHLVPVEVHRIGQETAGHELAIAHGAGIGALEGQRVHALLPGQDEVALELAGKKRRARGIIECQGGERIDHPIAAGHPAVVGFDADNGDDDFRRHTGLPLGPLQGGTVLRVEFQPLLQALVVEEYLAVFIPGLALLRRAGDGLEDTLLPLGAGEQLQ